MSLAARARPRRVLARVCAGAALLALAGTACFLPFAGRFLVREDPLEPADAIFVLAGGRVDRWLEGTELYRERIAPAIVLSPGIVTKAEMDLRAKGIRFPGEAELARDAMLQLGIPAEAVRVLPGTVDNTAHEAEAFHHLVRQTGWQRIVVVTSPYHVRRAGFAFRREFEGTGVEIVVHGSRYSDARPTRWWTQRSDIRYLMNEMPKFLAYVVGLGE